MSTTGSIVHPYMPNSVPEVKDAMLEKLNITSIEELYEDIPQSLRLKKSMNLPEPLLSELELKKHMESILSKNTSCTEMLNFLGAGCYQHYIPAICDEINNRSEFLTAYCGETYSDHGKLQAIFEYTSMMGELLDMDVVSYTTYDGGQATVSSLRMASRITNRREILLPETINPEILSQIKDYCKKSQDIQLVRCDSHTGQMDINDLKIKISSKTAAVFFENPSYLGFIEEHGELISSISHQHGALTVVSVDPSSLGILEAPVNYGADIVCGDIQPLGIHMHYGGGCAGFIATRDDEKYIAEYPTYFYSITTTKNEEEYGFGRALNYRTSHGSRENAKEYFGTAAGLWAITAGVYMALMGPKGMEELGENILYKCNYTSKLLSTIKGIRTPLFQSSNFKEFLVNFDETGKTVAEINRALLKYNIFGGKDLSQHFPHLGNSALYCVTEVMGIEDIHRLADALKKIIEG